MPDTPANPNYETFVRRILDQEGFIKEIGATLEHLAPGRVDLALVPLPGLLQFTGAVHGGVVSALADHAAGAAATTLLPEGQIAVTVEYKINFLRQAKGERVVAEAEVEQSGRKFSVATSNVYAETADGTRRKCAVAIVTLVPAALGE